MVAFLLWCILFVVCWPVALLALIAYPFIWLLLLPFRLVGIAVRGVLGSGSRKQPEIPPAHSAMAGSDRRCR